MESIFLTKVPNLGETHFEVVERKGIGHPDTIADALAENLSVAYSKYTLEKFGVILHHNFDKLAVLGGKTDVTFRKGTIIKPIRILLNGRASTMFGNKVIPVKKILEKETMHFFTSLFKDTNLTKHIIFQYNISDASGPGRTRESKGARAHIFQPRNKNEVKGYDKLVNNDTSIGCGYAPLSKLENAILQLEIKLNSKKIKENHPWMGTDIKVMGIRMKDEHEVTVCIPEIAKYVRSPLEYKNNLEIARKLIKKILIALLKTRNIKIFLNTRDDYEKGDIYLTAIGSSIESGDEGIVGRGNRVNGLITPMRPMNIEGANGKNPKYYTGKLYNVAATRIASKIYEKTGSYTEVFLISQNGRDIIDPWAIFVKTDSKNSISETNLRNLIEKEVKKIPEITQKILERKIGLY